MQITIRHETAYEFDGPVPYALQRLRLKPKSAAGQDVVEWRMYAEGGTVEAEFEDHHHNGVALVRANENVEKLTIVCEGTVTTDPDYNGINGRHRGYLPLWLFRQRTDLTQPGAVIRKLIETIGEREYANDIERLHAISAFVLSQVEYQVGSSHVDTTAEEAAANRSGVCQDHAHIFIAIARELGYPARYVGGYLFMSDRTEQEAGHAWAEAWVKDLGWIGFDISNGISPDEKYVRVATGFDYREAAPISALSFGAKDKNMNVKLNVARGSKAKQAQEQGERNQ